MGFLAGRMSFERFVVHGDSPRQFDQKHIKLLAKHAIGQIESASVEAPSIGFAGGKHLFDLDFDLEKNVIVDGLHASVRVDTAKVPGPLKKAWLEMELAAAAANSPTGRVTRADRQQAKEAVQARCDDEIRDGHFRRMQMVPFLWHLPLQTVLFGSTNAASNEHIKGLLETTFKIKLARITAGTLAEAIAIENGWEKGFSQLTPSEFTPSHAIEQLAWLTEKPDSTDYLGNEFLLWTWWWLETQAESIALSDQSNVTGMMNKTLVLECPRGESGKETITAESPTSLPEALHAVRAGKLPRKMGITLVRDGEQYELVLQAESFSVTGAAIQSSDDGRGRAAAEERIAAIRRMTETIDFLYEAFLERRLSRKWNADLATMQAWLAPESKPIRRAG